ncbi:MAG: hypothetical protein LBH16_11055 [Treponema sp.]|jgi:phage gp36-like protein|nr:hypothetical protein [Treponema sp.]
MAKITDQERNNYKDRVKHYELMAASLLKTEKALLAETMKETPEAVMHKLALVDEMLNLSSSYIAISGVSQAVFKIKNEEALNEARKSIYRAVIYLEEIVSNYIDAPFSEYEERLSAIASFDPNQRYGLIRKMGLAIDLLENAYGDNSKWKWTFVEIEGRYATTAKNIIDLRNIYTNMNFESPYYESTVYHLRLIKKLLAQSADRYREKYELSTGQTLDFKIGINFLIALRRLHIILSESEDAESVKKKMSIWTQKLDADVKKQEEAKKKAMAL